MDETDRLVRLKELKTIVGLSGTTICRRCKDGTFPAPLKIGPGIQGATAWRLSEVTAWMKQGHNK